MNVNTYSRVMDIVVPLNFGRWRGVVWQIPITEIFPPLAIPSVHILATFKFLLKLCGREFLENGKILLKPIVMFGVALQI